MAQATLGNGIKLLQLIRDKHCSTAKVEQLLPFFSDLIDASRYLPNRNAFRELLGIETGKYTAEVVYARKTFERRIAENKFAWVDPRITKENFPISGKGKIKRKFRLLRFGRTTTDNALAGTSLKKCRPATIAELLAFAAAYPDLQCQFPIVALGSDCRTGSCSYVSYPFLTAWSTEKRRLELEETTDNFTREYRVREGIREHNWGSECRFLVVVED